MAALPLVSTDSELPRVLRVRNKDTGEVIVDAEAAPMPDVVVPASALAGEEPSVLIDIDGPNGARTFEVPFSGRAFTDRPRPSWVAEPDEIELIPTNAGTAGERWTLVILPSGGDLVAGVPNRVLVRVSLEDGEALANVSVVVDREIDGDGPGPTYALIAEGTTDAAGLFDFETTAGAATAQWRVRVENDSARAKDTVSLSPRLTKTRIEPPLVVFRPGEPMADLQLHSYHETSLAYCDAREGDALRWATTVTVSDRRATLNLPPLSGGVHVLQCAYHPAQPGNAESTVWLIPTRGGQIDAAVKWIGDLADDDPWVGWVQGRAAALEADDATRARVLAWFGSLRRAQPIDLQLLVDSVKLDTIESAGRMRKTQMGLLALLGAGFLAMTLWMFASIAAHHRSMKASMHRYRRSATPEELAELTEMPADLTTLGRKNSRLQVIAVGIIVVLNAIGILILLEVVAR